jgi:hypothetical protein
MNYSEKGVQYQLRASGIVVSGQHDDLDVHGVQFAYCGCRCVAGSVRESENADGAPVDRNEHSCTPGRGEFISTAPQVTDVHTFGRHEAAVAD